MPVFLSPDFPEEACDLSDDAYRAHIEALFAASRHRLKQRIPKQMEIRSLCTETAAELVGSGWWVDEGEAWDVSVRAKGLWRLKAPPRTDVEIARERDADIRRRLGINVQVLERDGRRCVQCGTGETLTVDHRYPQILGGCWEPVNLQTLCRRCNSRKGTKVLPGVACCGVREVRCDGLIAATQPNNLTTEQPAVRETSHLRLAPDGRPLGVCRACKQREPLTDGRCDSCLAWDVEEAS